MSLAEPDAAAHLYPIALDLRGRDCVVVGGGGVGARKADALLAAGASVTVIDPDPSIDLPEPIRHRRQAFTPEHLDGALLAVAATDDPDVNRAVVDAARRRGVLINQAGSASEETMDGDFVTMASVRRGELLIALTTGGAGPALTARLRGDLEERFTPEWGPYVALLREMRERAKVSIPDSRQRTEALRRLASAEGIRVALAAGDIETARTEALACLS